MTIFPQKKYRGFTQATLAAAWACLFFAARSDLRALPFSSEIDVLLEYDSNLNRTYDDSAREQDTAIHLVASGDRSLVLNRDWLFSWGGVASAQHWLKYEKIDAADLSVRIALRKRFGLGTTAPLMRFEISGGPAWSRTTSLGGWTGTTGLSFSHRPNEWLKYGFAGELDRSSKRDSLFSGDGATISAFVQTTVSERVSLNLALRQRQGQVIAFARAYTYDAYLYYNPWKLRYLDAFYSTPIAYPLLARTQGATLSGNISLGPRQALRFAWDYSVTERAITRYVVNFISLGFALQF